jgi:2'-5' RNA ligase
MMDTVNSMRLFVAMPVPSGIKHVVASWMDELKPHLPFRKWVHPEDLHITLQFLGDTPSESVPHIQQVLQEIMTLASPLSLRIESLGFFGRLTQPSVLWAGVGGEVEAVHELQQQVAGALMKLGFTPEERTFHPHLTLARNYTGTTPFERSKLSTYTIPNAPQDDLLSWKTNEVTLYRSHLNKRPMYEAISFSR